MHATSRVLGQQTLPSPEVTVHGGLMFTSLLSPTVHEQDQSLGVAFDEASSRDLIRTLSLNASPVVV